MRKGGEGPVGMRLHSGPWKECPRMWRMVSPEPRLGPRGVSVADFPLHVDKVLD